MTIAMWCSTSRTRELELVAHRADQLAQLVDLGVGEAGRGLVEQQQPRARRERPGDLDALQRAVRQADRGPVGEVVEREPLEDLVRLGRAAWRRRDRCEYPPTSTLSSTVSAGNSARFWNVRAMPSRAMRCAGSASRSWPSKLDAARSSAGTAGSRS